MQMRVAAYERRGKNNNNHMWAQISSVECPPRQLALCLLRWMALIAISNPLLRLYSLQAAVVVGPMPIWRLKLVV